MKERKSRILVVDDTPANITILSELLMEDYELSVAMSGQDALDLAVGNEVPDLILLDIVMPEMDGYEVCRCLKEDPRTAEIPIIFVTAKTKVDDEALGFKMGAVDFITKPISAPIVLARVRSTLKLKQAREELADAYQLVSSSIQYASKIQRSILPVSSDLDEAFNEYFTIWEPRDDVGGDFYFHKHWGNGQIMVLGDCTGHGVPGAFMTLIVHGALDMAIKSVPEGDVATLLQQTHQHIQTSLSQHLEEGDSDDGVEMGICYLSEGKQSMTYAGARFSLFILRDGVVEEVKGDKKGMGYRGIPYDSLYTNQDIALHGKCNFYMTSDGLTDQVGGENGRGFGKKRFRTLLKDIQFVALPMQGGRIKEALKAHQGNESRRDDVAVLGFNL